MGHNSDSMFTSTRRTSEIDWNDWPSAIDAFQQRYEEWYFNPLIEIQRTGHEAFPVYLTCGMLISNLSTFIFGSSEDADNFLYGLSTTFAEPVTIIMHAGARIGYDIADVFLESVQTLLISGSLGKMCSHMDLQTYTSFIERIKGAGLVEESKGGMLTWVGPVIAETDNRGVK